MLLHMFLINLILAAAVAFVAHRLGAPDAATFLVGWFTLRLETALGNQMVYGRAVRQLMENDNARMQAVKDLHEQRVANIARNN